VKNLEEKATVLILRRAMCVYETCLSAFREYTAKKLYKRKRFLLASYFHKMECLARALSRWGEAVEERKGCEAQDSVAIKHWGRRLRGIVLLAWVDVLDICKIEQISSDVADDAYDRKLRAKGMQGWRRYCQVKAPI
jgi:hypothetical protein